LQGRHFHLYQEICSSEHKRQKTYFSCHFPLKRLPHFPSIVSRYLCFDNLYQQKRKGSSHYPAPNQLRTSVRVSLQHRHILLKYFHRTPTASHLDQNLHPVKPNSEIA